MLFRLRRFVFAGIFILLTAACSAGEARTTISFMTWGDPAERDAYLQLVAAFEEVHPDIDVEVSHIPNDREYRTRLATNFAAGTPPDVILMNYRRIAGFAAKGLLEPLGPYLDASDVITAKDFYPQTIEAFIWQGTLTCIPQNISNLVVYYNQDLFDAAGLPYPPDDWNWDDFLQTAIALTKDLDGDGVTDQYGLGSDPILYRLSAFVWQNGGVIMDDLYSPTRLTLTRFPSQQALQWFVDLSQVHGVAPGRVEEASLDNESRFIAGTIGLYLNSRRSTPTFREIESFAWDVAPMPTGKQAASMLHSDAYCLSSAAENKEAAWTFIEFANSVAGQTIVAGTGRTVPSLVAVAESDAFLNPDQSPRRSRVFLDQIPYLQRVPLISTWEEIERTADQEIDRAFYGDITAEEAARLIDQRTEEYFLMGIGPSRQP